MGGKISKELKCMLIGNDTVGKTTILNTLKLNELVVTMPTVGFNVE
jgi:GTPase SAR1 family protein